MIQYPKTKARVISFDLWGTIIKGNPEHGEQRNKLMKKILFPEMSKVGFDKKVKSAKEFADYSNEGLGQQLSWEQAMLMTCFDSSEGPIKAQLIERFKKYELEYQKIAQEYLPLIYSDETKKVLTQLKGKDIPVIYSSNSSFGTGNMMQVALYRLGLLDNKTSFVFSDIIKVSKPSSQFFTRVFSNSRSWYNDLIPGQMLHVGDNDFADSGCLQVGIPFLHINSDSGNTIAEVLNYI